MPVRTYPLCADDICAWLFLDTSVSHEATFSIVRNTCRSIEAGSRLPYILIMQTPVTCRGFLFASMQQLQGACKTLPKFQTAQVGAAAQLSGCCSADDRLGPSLQAAVADQADVGIPHDEGAVGPEHGEMLGDHTEVERLHNRPVHAAAQHGAW